MRQPPLTLTAQAGVTYRLIDTYTLHGDTRQDGAYTMPEIIAVIILIAIIWRTG
jgi:type II secretory pathway pseudopilin PulG